MDQTSFSGETKTMTCPSRTDEKNGKKFIEILDRMLADRKTPLVVNRLEAVRPTQWQHHAAFAF